MATTRPALTRDSLGAWLLKSSPRATPVEELLVRRTTTRCLRPSYRTTLVEAGQPVLLWISGGDRAHPSGVYAEGRATGPVTLDADGSPVMPVELEPLAHPVLRTELLAHPVLSRLEVLRMPVGSNPSHLTPDEWAAYRHLR